MKPYVHSSYERVADDYYPTIDKRCVYGFLEYFTPQGVCVDVCSPNGSGIVDTLKECGYDAYGIGDAFVDKIDAEWIITNPPYDKKIVDKIINRCIRRPMDGEVFGVAVLLRSNFDYAKSRWSMFSASANYYGQVKLLFRPWWSVEHTKSPIHSYCWHIWANYLTGYPVVHYAKGVYASLP